VVPEPDGPHLSFPIGCPVNPDHLSLTVIAGVMRIRLDVFLVLVTAGKFLRYVVISYLTLTVQ
jgi:membrane protein YqaA with SNARE-associated domain